MRIILFFSFLYILFASFLHLLIINKHHKYLTKYFIFTEIWFCPRHKCSLCSRATKRCCKFCATAYCFSHTDNNIFSDNNGGLLCSQHMSATARSNQPTRKPSYVNRNTPVLEYEKPFAEKYRPPPLKERLNSGPSEKENEILMEPNLMDHTPILVENPLLSSQSEPSARTSPSSRLNDGVSVQVLYLDEEGRIVNVDSNNTNATNTGMLIIQLFCQSF